jgi:predicted TIM-barrel fold metal-dependent hydrolase
VEINELIETLTIIDADSHLTETADLWESRVPESLKSKVPLQKTVDGVTSWYLGDDPWSGLGGNVIQTGNVRAKGVLYTHPFEAIDKAAWSVPDRLELLDKMGIGAQILYPNGIGFASNHIFAIDDQELRKLVLQTYNDFLIDVQEESKGRLIPQAILPVWDMDFTVKEMTRLLDKGIRGFTLSDKPELLGLPELPEPYFDPMWDIFNEAQVPVNFHIASGATLAQKTRIWNLGLKDNERLPQSTAPVPQTARSDWSYFGRQRGYVVRSSQSSMSNMRIIANLVMSDIFDRFSKLKVVSVESGVGWVPFLLESLEFLFDDMVTEEAELNLTKRRPSEYFYDHVSVTFWFEKSGPERLLDLVGIRNVLVGTDIPHPSSLFPGAKEHFTKVLANQSEEVVRRVLQDNAAELYGIDVS